MTDFNKDRAEKLINSIMTNPNSDRSGVLINDLLREFHRGYSLNNLQLLLHNQNQVLVTIGTWIASELGEKGKPLLSDVFGLLSYPAKEVRFDAIDCILVWAAPSDRLELASTVMLLDDPEPSVRWKVMDFLSRASEEQLQAALSHFVALQPESPYVIGLKWLISPDARNTSQIMDAIKNGSVSLRKYAVAAAARIAEKDSGPLLYASSIEDPDIKSFAESRIGLL